MLNAIIDKYTKLTGDIVSLELSKVDGSDFNYDEAGCHIDIKTPAGVVRQYSLYNNPALKNRIQVAIKRDPNSRGGSQSIHDQLSQGDTVKISEPRNNFRLRDNSRKKILIAAGIGVTPIISMAYACLNKGFDFELHYFVRNEESIGFADLLKAPTFAKNSYIYIGRSAEQVADTLERDIYRNQTGIDVYTCGPEPFMDAVFKLADAKNSDITTYKESFSANEEALSKPKSAFNAVIKSSGEEIFVSAEESLAEALGKSGIDIPVSCGEGICGTCLVPLSEGKIDHRDSFLTKEEIAENDMLCACVSRAESEKIVLDL